MTSLYRETQSRVEIIEQSYIGWSTHELIDEFIVVCDEADTGDQVALARWMSMGAALILRGYTTDQLNRPWEMWS